MKKIYLLLFVGLLLVGGAELQAQQQYQLSQYFQHPNAINPSLSGIDDFWKINVGYRQQWSGLEGAPEVFFLSFNGFLKKSDIRMNSIRISRPEAYEELETNEAYRRRMRKHGLGGYVSQLEFGPLRVTTGLATYAYHIPLNRNLNLSVGVAAAVNNNGFNQQNYNPRTTNDEVYNALISGDINQTYFDLNTGATLYGKNFYAGYSATQLVMARTSSSDELADPTTYINHYGMLGYQLNLSPQLRLQPSLLIRYNQINEAGFDANVKLRFDDLIWAGVSYRDKNALAGMFGLIVNKNVTMAYAYEQNTGEFNIENNGTHEVVLGLRLGNRYGKTPYFW